MVQNAVVAAKRALVSLLLCLARAYNVALSINRESVDKDIVAAARLVSRRTHPDKGGNVKDQTRLNTARHAWEVATKSAVPAGRRWGQESTPTRAPTPSSKSGRKCSSSVLPILVTSSTTSTSVASQNRQAKDTQTRREYRVHSEGVLLTYQGFKNLAQWLRFNKFVRASLSRWTAKHWCCTLETNVDGSYHAHLMLQFRGRVDKTVHSFIFEGLRPNASCTDLLGDGYSRKKLQQSLDRGFFYVWADKIGTARDEGNKPCLAGNYEPCWTKAVFKFPVLGVWPDKLWTARKLSDETFKEYLFLCRDGVVSRKRNFDAVLEHDSANAARASIAARTLRIRTNPALYELFGNVPAAQAWLERFRADALRYPVLLVLGPSCCGKTEWASSLFKCPLELKVGTLSYFPDGVRAFNRDKHDGIVLDDVRDLQFLADHQEKLQGKYNALVEFASTPGGTCAHFKDMFAVPIAITVNYSTKNLQFLETHDWLRRPENVTHITFAGRPGS
jgi:hypothetical protein